MSASDQHDATTIVFLIIGAIIVLPILSMGTGVGGMAGHGGMMGGYGTTSGWGSLVGMFVQLAVPLVVLGGGYLAFRRVTESRSSRDPAMEELRAAYARGDLTDDEFAERRTRLERSE